MQRLYPSIATFLITFLITIPSFCQTHVSEITNYYGTSETITFNNLDYKFSWSSHPNAVSYKHEYIPNGNSAEHFEDMLMLDFIQGDLKLKDVVQTQVNNILERKKTDAVCNYDLVESPDGKEFILDFLMSTSKNDKVNLIEWNAYHYKNYTDNARHMGVVLFAVSHRAYDNDVTPFLKSLSEYREVNRNELIKFSIPEIQIK
jgi:hypothetical protein